MAGSTFKTNPFGLYELLQHCEKGILQLPDFQRSWVWDEERIKSLISSVSRAFPIGALMTLETGGEVDFKPRAIEGAPVAATGKKPQSLLLDRQQRMTSLIKWHCAERWSRQSHRKRKKFGVGIISTSKRRSIHLSNVMKPSLLCRTIRRSPQTLAAR